MKMKTIVSTLLATSLVTTGMAVQETYATENFSI